MNRKKNSEILVHCLVTLHYMKEDCRSTEICNTPILGLLQVPHFQQAELMMEDGMDDCPDILRREFEAYMEERFLTGQDAR